MAVELVPRTHLGHSAHYGSTDTDGHRDGASDLGRGDMVSDHAYDPRRPGWQTFERCAHCHLYMAAHTDDGLPF